MKLAKDSLLPWAVLLVLALGVAYWASLPQSEPTGNVSVLDLKAGEIEGIELHDSGGEIVAKRQSQNNDRWWITVERDQKQLDNATSSPKDLEHFLASERFNDYLQKIAKLNAQRDLGRLSDPDLKNYGFSEQAAKFRLKTAGGDVLSELLVGKQLYGSRSTYVMRTSDRNIFLVSADVMDDFSKPEARFFERKITNLDTQNLQSVTLVSPDKTKLLVRTKKEENGVSQWASDSVSGKIVGAAGVWIERFTELKAASFVTDELRQIVMQEKPILTLTLVDSAGKSAKVIMLRHTQDQKSEFYVYTEYLSWPVKVATARAENLIKDLPLLLND